MNYTVFMPVLIAFAFSAILGPIIIPVLRKLKMNQTEREDGVKSHLKKAGTPSMGGVIILFECGTYFNLLYQRLSEDHPDPVCDSWLWSDRFSG